MGGGLPRSPQGKFSTHQTTRLSCVTREAQTNIFTLPDTHSTYFLPISSRHTITSGVYMDVNVRQLVSELGLGSCCERGGGGWGGTKPLLSAELTG